MIKSKKAVALMVFLSSDCEMSKSEVCSYFKKKVYVLKSDGLSLLLSLFIIKLLLLSALLVLLFLVVVIYCYHMGVSLSHGVPRYSRMVYHGKSC